MSVAAVIQVAVVGLLLFACYTDLVSLKIPNSVSIAIVALFIPFAYATHMIAHDILLHLAAGVSVLVLGFILFSLGLRFGGGDVKLLSALSLWCGFASLVPYFVAMSFFGGILAVTVFLARQSGIGLWLAAHGWNIPAMAIDRGKPYVPYAPAITAGFIFVSFGGSL